MPSGDERPPDRAEATRERVRGRRGARREPADAERRGR